jgi:hypothetical protein
MNDPRYHERIAAFYRHHGIEKPASHIEFLLSKYRGHEDAVIHVLVEKYGPEPSAGAGATDLHSRVEQLLTRHAADGAVSPAAVKAVADPYQGQETTLMRELHQRYPGSEGQGASTAPAALGVGGDAPSPAAPGSNYDFDAALRRRQEQFRNDMAGMARDATQRQELEAVHEVADAKLLVQRQEVEIQQMRMSLSAFQLQAAADEAAFNEQINGMAKLLTQAKLKSLALQSTHDGAVVAMAELEDVVAASSSVEGEMARTVAYSRSLADVVRRHLSLYPLSPMHATLRQLDAALCARLEE